MFALAYTSPNFLLFCHVSILTDRLMTIPAIESLILLLSSPMSNLTFLHLRSLYL